MELPRLSLFKTVITIFLLTFINVNVSGTTWAAAYPYKQYIEGQKVRVEAYPYDPYSGSPMIGLTKVYYDNKLLYTIDKYYRENIYTSNDGQFLAIVYNSNSLGVTSYTSIGNQQIDFNQSAVELFKDGKPFKTFTLKDVIDTAKLTNNGRFFYWGYYVNFEVFEKAGYSCESCKEVYGKKVLRKCEPFISATQCEECRKACNLVREKEIEKNVLRSSIYVQNNALFVLTNQNTIVKLDFSTFDITQIQFDKIILDKKAFNPPKLIRQFKKIKLPDQFDEPNFNDGRSFEKGVAEILGMSVSESDSGVYFIYIHSLLLDIKGKCVNFEGTVYDRRISKYFTDESINIVLTEKLKQSIESQTFQTKLIPKRFEGYSFLCMVYLK